MRVIEDKKSFTLVEVIVALVIVLLTATGIFADFIVAKTHTSRSTNKISALNFARQEMERLRLKLGENNWNKNPPEGFNPGGGWSSWENLPGDFGSKLQGRRRYMVEAVAGADFRKITVEISWQEFTL